jgi:UPF0716 protein FxsA
MTTGSHDPHPTRHQGNGRAASRRRGPRALLPLGIAAWALLEIWLLTLVGEAAGGLTVFLLLVAGVVVGAAVIRRAGRRAWQRLAAAMQQPGEAAGPEADSRGGNGLIMLGGLLLMVPGLLSDVLGLLCLFPPTGALLRRVGARYVGGAFDEARRAEEQLRARRPDGKVVPGEVVRDDDDQS